MEDVFKILIWLIIIISFFSSILKKKDKGKKPNQGLPKKENEGGSTYKAESQTKSTDKKSEIESYNDILSEIETLFKNENVPGEVKDYPKSTTSNKTKIEEHETSKKEGQKRVTINSEHTETAAEHVPGDDWKKEEKMLEKKASADFIIESEAKKFEELLNRSESDDRFTKSIREKLGHPESLKDYILISEIIGKPVSLSAARQSRGKPKVKNR